MKRILFPFLLQIMGNTANAQDIVQQQEAIEKEAKLLYCSEMSSWYGTDLFLEQFKEREKVGGYISYTDKELNKCVFYSSGATPVAIGTVSFNKNFSVEEALVDLSERPLTSVEVQLITLRKNALSAMQGDTLFKQYRNTNLNLIPLISEGERKVYVLTGPQQSGMVLFGNDYLLTFNNNNELKGKKALHRNLIEVPYGKEGEGIIGTMHTHLPSTGELITATDLCTLMLYSKFVSWKKHTVIGAKYMSLWDCETQQLVVLKKEVVERISKSQKQN